MRQLLPLAGNDVPPVLTEVPSIEQAVRMWHAAGHSQRAIARELNLDRRKVKRIIDQAT
jgi:DNA-binding transcriptional regulator LsrR (DeoR family)